MVGIQVTKRSERASHLPHYSPYVVSYRNIQRLDKTSKKGEERTNILEGWRELARRRRQA